MKRTSKKRTSVRYLYIFALLALLTYVFTIGINGTQGSDEPIHTIEAAPIPTADSPDPEPFEPDGKGEEPAPRYREVSAYNVGIEAQTDATPCIGATGQDLCKLLAEGRKIVATNELPLGSKVKINGQVFEVLDRMNSRYQYRYDIAMSADQKAEAIDWGIKIIDVQPL